MGRKNEMKSVKASGPVQFESLERRQLFATNLAFAPPPGVDPAVVQAADAALAAEVSKVSIANTSSVANWQSFDPSTRVTTLVAVQVGTSSVVNSSGVSSTSTLLSVSIVVFNWSTLTKRFILGITGPNDPVNGSFTYRQDASLQTASVVGTVNAQDESTNTIVPVNVNVVWDATGHPVTTTTNTTVHPLGQSFALHDTSTSCDAIATGTVAIGSDDFLTGDSTFAFINRDRSGSVVVTRTVK